MGYLFYSLLFLTTIIIILYQGKQSSWNFRYFLYTIIAIFLFLDLIYVNYTGIYFLETIKTCSLTLSLSFLVYLITSLYTNKFLNIIYKFTDCILLIITLFPLLLKYTLNLKSFSKECIISLFQTNLFESIDFINTGIPFYCFIIAVIILLLIITFSNSHKLYVSKKILISLFVISYFTYNSCSSIIFIKGYNQQYNEHLKAIKNNLQATDYSNFTYNKDSINYILIIGESLCRDYMSAYGYHIKTTPNIDKLIKDSTFIRFDNSYSANLKTIKCIPDIITSKNQFRNNNIDYNLINVLKNNGYYTYWISNQSEIGMYDTPITLLAKQADYQRFKPIGGGYDEELLLELEKVITNNTNIPKAIFIHLMGQHTSASSQYPHVPPFLRDTLYYNDYLYHYENSIIYNDYIINQIYKLCTQLNKTVIIYLSDHGEKPGSIRLEDKIDYQMFRIPTLIYFSPDIKNSTIYSRLKENSNKYWSNDLLFELTCSILGVKNAKFIDTSKDISSSMYSLSIDSFSLVSGQYRLKDDPYNIQQ